LRHLISLEKDVSRFLTVALSLAFLAGLAGSFGPTTDAFAYNAGSPRCADGHYASVDKQGIPWCGNSPYVVCPNGQIVDNGHLCPDPSRATPTTPTTEVQKCSNGTVVPTTTVAKGGKAIQAWCAALAAGTVM
jgi:hypothetical protein